MNISKRKKGLFFSEIGLATSLKFQTSGSVNLISLLSCWRSLWLGIQHLNLRNGTFEWTKLVVKVHSSFIKEVFFSPVGGSVKSEEILHGEDHHTGCVQAEKRDFVLVTACQHLQLGHRVNIQTFRIISGTILFDVLTKLFLRHAGCRNKIKWPRGFYHRINVCNWFFCNNESHLQRLHQIFPQKEHFNEFQRPRTACGQQGLADILLGGGGNINICQYICVYSGRKAKK